MIYRFDTNDIPALSQVGGKAKALMETTRAGFNVPGGIVLAVDFFSDWTREIKATDTWKAFLNSPVKERCDALKQKAIELKLNTGQKEAVDKELANLSEAAVFAVRSSSPEEDLAETSFAGQYDTFLGVTSGKIGNAIVGAFASMFDTRVVEYKKLHNLPIDNPQIAVIVQKQIASDVSGIAFSLNPDNNCYDEAVINASFGLGETIVAGQVTPDTYIVEKVKKVILEKKVPEKPVGLRLQENGGTIEKENAEPKAQALTDAQILEVADLAAACEKHYGKPIDIEWAMAGGVLYLLQARPITTYLPLFPELLTALGATKNLYIDIIGMSQGFTESLSVMGLEIWSIMLEIAKGGTTPVAPDGAVVSIHGRQYMHFSNILKGYGIQQAQKIFGSYERGIRKIFENLDLTGEYLPARKTAPMKKIWMAMLKMVLKMLPSVIKALRKQEEAVTRYKALSQRIFRQVRTELNATAPFNKTVNNAMNMFGDLVNMIGVMLVGMMAMGNLKKMFKGDDAEHLITTLGMDLPGNPTSKMGHYLYKLACFDEVKQTKTGEEFAGRIAARDYSKELLDAYAEYMELYGCRGFKEIDVAAPRTYEDPAAFFNQLKFLNTEDNQLLGIKEKREQAYNVLLERAKAGGFEKKFKKQAEMYYQTFGFREDPKYIYIAATARLHDIALEIGGQFVKQGRLEAKAQIFDLTPEQVALGQHDPSANLGKLREANLAPYKTVAHVKEWPAVINSRGKIFRPVAETNDGDLVGEPISAGVVQGRAKVLFNPYEKRLEPGEILVTKATEPAWTPVFVNAAAVVLEIGGQLQHGAIIAREYGIPCVSGIGGVQTLIKDGDLLEVDGSSGIVKIIKA